MSFIKDLLTTQGLRSNKWQYRDKSWNPSDYKIYTFFSILIYSLPYTKENIYRTEGEILSWEGSYIFPSNQMETLYCIWIFNIRMLANRFVQGVLWYICLIPTQGWKSFIYIYTSMNCIHMCFSFSVNSILLSQ